jgi:hypothetical protein
MPSFDPNMVMFKYLDAIPFQWVTHHVLPSKSPLSPL